jgi:hypothetical protein
VNIGRRKKDHPSPRGRVCVECRLSDWRWLDRDEFERAQPLQRGTFGFYTVTWLSDWFEPSVQLPLFPYVGSFENSTGKLWFACDGEQVAGFAPWLPCLNEMLSAPPKTEDGQIDQGRLDLFERYRAVHERAIAIIHEAAV